MRTRARVVVLLLAAGCGTHDTPAATKAPPTKDRVAFVHELLQDELVRFGNVSVRALAALLRGPLAEANVTDLRVAVRDFAAADDGIAWIEVIVRNQGDYRLLAHSDPKQPVSTFGEPLPLVSGEAWTAVLAAWHDRKGDAAKQDPLISGAVALASPCSRCR